AGRIRAGLRDSRGPDGQVRRGVPAGGRGPGAARPGPGARGRDGKTPGDGAGSGRARHRAGEAPERRARAVVRLPAEEQPPAGAGAHYHRGEGIRPSPLVIHRERYMTMATLYPPYIIERSSRGERSYDIFSRLLMDRIVFLGAPINDDVANIIIAQLLFLDADNPERDIYLYINSPGGIISS